MKDQTFKMRIDAKERSRLETVAKHYGLKVPQMIRFLVQREMLEIVERKKNRQRQT